MDILKELGIQKINSGTCYGSGTWSDSDQNDTLNSYNPATGELLGSILQATEQDVEAVISDSVEAFKEWRTVPAPIRGQLVREMGDALRKKKDALGTLVSMEMGKIYSWIWSKNNI